MIVAISASGSSPNVVRGVTKAREMGLSVVTLPGFDGGKITDLGTVTMTVPLETNEQVGDAHSIVLHMIVQALKRLVQLP